MLAGAGGAGGTGGGGGSAMTATVENTGGLISTAAERSPGLLAQSIGGDGGNGLGLIFGGEDRADDQPFARARNTKNATIILAYSMF